MVHVPESEPRDVWACSDHNVGGSLLRLRHVPALLKQPETAKDIFAKQMIAESRRGIHSLTVRASEDVVWPHPGGIPKRAAQWPRARAGHGRARRKQSSGGRGNSRRRSARPVASQAWRVAQLPPPRHEVVQRLEESEQGRVLGRVLQRKIPVHICLSRRRLVEAAQPGRAPWAAGRVGDVAI